MNIATVVALENRFCWHQITPRLGFISRAPKTKKGKQAIVTVYAGFDSVEAAGKFAIWIGEKWEKHPEFEISTRPSQRLSTAFEVKIRKPTLEQLHALIAKATQVPDNVIPFKREAS